MSFHAIAHYRITDGGMGQVYCAIDTKLNREVAIKVISEKRGDRETLARFAREAQLLASLNHPTPSTSTRATEAAVF